MKKTHWLALVGCVCFAFSSGAFAKDKKTEKPKETVTVPTYVPAESSSIKRYALGISTGTVAGPGLGSSALTGAIEFDSINMVQGFFTMPTTSPFTFSVGGIYKHTLIERQGAGVHIGAGASLGSAAGSTTVDLTTGNTSTKTSFAGSIGGIGGIHFSIPGLRDIAFHFDGGAIFAFGDNTTFHIGALSEVAGMSVLLYL